MQQNGPSSQPERGISKTFTYYCSSASGLGMIGFCDILSQNHDALPFSVKNRPGWAKTALVYGKWWGVAGLYQKHEETQSSPCPDTELQ